MTREEAIHIIEKDIQIDVRSCTNEEVHRFITALNMAIAALREQDATDTNVGKTNADHIRSMTDEELADYMSEHSIESFCYIICGGECKAVATFNKTSDQRCREIVADWLKQPYKEGA